MARGSNQGSRRRRSTQQDAIISLAAAVTLSFAVLAAVQSGKPPSLTEARSFKVDNTWTIGQEMFGGASEVRVDSDWDVRK